MCKSGICYTKPAIFLKQNSLEPKLLQNVHKTPVWPIDWWQIWRPMINFGLLFRGVKFFHHGYLVHFLSERDEIWQRWGLANWNLFPEFRKLWSGGPVIPCSDMHNYFTGTLLKWFFDNFALFADSFSVLSIHCVARCLGASFLYKCPASRGGLVPCDSTALLLFLLHATRRIRPVKKWG